jgi:competence protein ComEC
MLLLCVAFLIGIGAARFGISMPLAPLLILAGLAAASFYKRTPIALLCIVVFGVCVGVYRGALFADRIAAYQPLYEHKIALTVVANNDAVYGTNGQLSFTAGRVRLDDGQMLIGTIQLSGFGLNMVYQGDVVQATGKLFPSLGQYQGRMSYAQLTLEKHQPTAVAEVRRKFAAGLQTALPEPLAPFALGLLVGQRATLPDQVKQDLLMVGLTHIIAVSGYNLTIILTSSQRVLARLSKRLAVSAAITLIVTFLLITGYSASIVRAAIVSMLSISAAYYGRRFRPLNLIAIAAAITAWAKPMYVWSDAGWYLSFLAFYGVLVLAPGLHATYWPKRWRKSLIASIALESICAEIMTLPYVLHMFGQMSYIGLVANVLVVTLIPLAMLLGVIAGLAGMLLSPLAGWFAWPARLLLNYMLDVAHVLSGLPHVFQENIALPLSGMLFLYACTIALTLLIRFKSRRESDIITDRNTTIEGALYQHVRSQQMVNN